MLSILGGGLGLLLAILATQLLVRAASGILPFLLAFDGRPDWRVLAATALFSLLSTLVAGLAPAWRASRMDVLVSLKDHEAGLMLAGRRFSIRNGLVVLQVAVCLALLVSAGLFVRGARVATNATPGFAPDRGILMQVDPTLAGYDASRSRATMKRVLDSLRSSSGIESASMASIVPFGEERDGSGVTRAGAGPETEPYGATYTVIGAHYFETLGIPILQGREFSPAEEFSTAGPAVAIIDEPLAALLFGQEPPFGQLIRIADDHPRTVQVIGIVAGVRNSIADSRSSAHLYVPFGQTSASPQYVHVRVRPGVDADTFQQSVRQMALNQDPDLPILKIRTLGQFFRESLPLWVLTTAGRLFSTFGVVALILAVAGVYGMRAYVVSQRRREIAIRLALGADPRTVRWMMVSEGFAVGGVGLVIGVAFAWALSRVLRGMLVGVSSTDPIVFASACATLALAVLAASYAPARRVTNMAPTDALRSE